MTKQLLEKIYKHVPQVKIAAHFDIKQSAVSQWAIKGIPANRVAALSKLTKGKVSKHEMRPDVFPYRKPRSKAV